MLPAPDARSRSRVSWTSLTTRLVVACLLLVTLAVAANLHPDAHPASTAAESAHPVVGDGAAAASVPASDDPPFTALGCALAVCAVLLVGAAFTGRRLRPAVVVVRAPRISPPLPPPGAVRTPVPTLLQLSISRT